MRINPLYYFITYACRFGMAFVYKFHGKELKKIPKKGPLLLYSNHTGMAEVPLFYTHLQPRKVTGLAKVEVWGNLFLALVFWVWQVIPLHRGTSDTQAMEKAFSYLKKGFILGISPEGTRSKSGKLLKARGGIVMMALRSGSPLQPLAHWGGEKLKDNLRLRKRTDVFNAVGRRFELKTEGITVTKEIRQQMTEEIMYQLAKILPEEFRGEYADMENATEEYIRYLE